MLSESTDKIKYEFGAIVEGEDENASEMTIVTSTIFIVFDLLTLLTDCSKGTHVVYIVMDSITFFCETE